MEQTVISDSQLLQTRRRHYMKTASGKLKLIEIIIGTIICICLTSINDFSLDINHYDYNRYFRYNRFGFGVQNTRNAFLITTFIVICYVVICYVFDRCITKSKEDIKRTSKFFMEFIVIVPHLTATVAYFVSIILNNYWDYFDFQQLAFCFVLIIICIWDLHLANKMWKAKTNPTDQSLAIVANAQTPTNISIIGLNDIMREKYPPPNLEESSCPAIIQIPPPYQVIQIQ